MDEWIAGLSDGASIAIVLLVAVLIGLRHATDPDHIAAVSTLVASGRERATAAAAHLGMWWGIGHAITLAAFGIPILVAERYLPDTVQRGAETAVAALIVFLAIRLLVRWRHGAFARSDEYGTDHHHPVRSSHAAFGIGLVAVLARRLFSRVSLDGPVVRSLPAFSALVIVVVGLAITAKALPGVV